MVTRVLRCLLPLLLLLQLWSSAQTDMEDVVYLKNGSMNAVTLKFGVSF